MPCAVVPVHTNLMRAATRSRDSEKKSMMPAVKMTRGKRELGELAANRVVVQRPIVTAKSVFVTVDKSRDCDRGDLTVFERTRNTFAHQRIHSGSIAGQNHPSACIAIRRVEPSNWKRLPRHRSPRHRIERK